MCVSSFLEHFAYVADIVCCLVNIETEGPYAPERLLLEAIKVMRHKIATIKEAAKGLMERNDGGGDVEMTSA